MDDINSKLSQLYDNELNQDQLDDVLKILIQICFRKIFIIRSLSS